MNKYPESMRGTARERVERREGKPCNGMLRWQLLKEGAGEKGERAEVRVQGNSIRVLYDFVLLVNFQNENSRRGWQT